jgi:hypothetical protein
MTYDEAMEIMRQYKYDKDIIGDHERVGLLRVGELFGDMAVIFQCVYHHLDNPKYASFINVRVFDDSIMRKTRLQLTDHINIPRANAGWYCHLDESVDNHRCWLLGTVGTYRHYGAVRGQVRLLEGLKSTPPIIVGGDRNRMLDGMVRAMRGYNAVLGLMGGAC